MESKEESKSCFQKSLENDEERNFKSKFLLSSSFVKHKTNFSTFSEDKFLKSKGSHQSSMDISGGRPQGQPDPNSDQDMMEQFKQFAGNLEAKDLK